MSAGLSPRPHQVAALTDLTRALALHDRAQLVMACGTGKTLVGRWFAETSTVNRVLVLVPSLALVAQTLGEWRRDTGWPFEALVVCSDPTTAAGAEERAHADDGLVGDVKGAYWSSARAQVTTDPGQAARFLRRHQAGRPQVVFSTYHSVPVVAAAQRAVPDTPFDLVICDEAHHLAGAPRESFRVALDRRGIVARKRLFMTATPRVVTGDEVLSMGDPAVFGPVAHTVTFRSAIDEGLLADYQVLVVAAAAASTRDEDRSTITPAALVDAIDHHGVRRVLSFHGRVAKAESFVDVLDSYRTPGGTNVRARAVAAGTLSDERARTLRWLGDPQTTQARVVASARCLSEGVDVPAVDGILFADTRTSVVDILQAIGRVLRPAPGKDRGTIIIPVALPPDGDDDTALSTSAFAHVWAVLRGLRAHDERLAEELDRLTLAHGRSAGSGGWRPARIHFQLPFAFDEAALRLRIVQEVGSAWERYYASAEDWAWHHDGKRLPRLTRHAGVGIGEWAVDQRLARTWGTLPGERIERLERIPGWYWDRATADWDDTYALLAAHTLAHGTVAENDLGESVFAGRHSVGACRRRLGVWVAEQRQRHRDALLDADHAAKLEQLPGWTWDGGLPAGDVAMVQALRCYVEFEKHAQVPDGHLEDGLPLGAWCWAVRRRRLTGRLHPGLYDEIVAATPPMQTTKSTGRRWLWEKPETQWRLAYFALRQYTARVGAATPPVGHTERLPDAALLIGQWTSLQRHKHRLGELDPARVALLEALPGWIWAAPLNLKPYGDPIDVGDHPHGTAKPVSAGCTCLDCRAYVAANSARYARRRRALLDPVPAGPAKTQLARLRNAGAKITAITTVSGVPLGVLRKLGADATHVERDHAAALLALTLEQVITAGGSAAGSRGRPISENQQRIPAGPTWVLLDDLRARGFGPGWVCRELGYASASTVFGRVLITRRVADRIADLHARTGDLTAPHRSPPRLADLQAPAHRDVA